MITGKLMFDIDISAKSEQEVEALEQKIKAAVEVIDGVEDVSQVDSDLEDNGEE